MRKSTRTSVALFYGAHADVDGLLDVADQVCSYRNPLFGATFAAEHRLDRIVRGLSEGRRKARGFLASGSSPYLIQVPFRESFPAGKRHARGFLWQTQEDSLVHLLAMKDDYRCLIRELRRYLLTDLTQVYLQTAGFKRCFDALVTNGAVDSIRVRDYTAWVMTDESKRAETRRVWPPEPLDHVEFFEKLEDEDQRVRSLGIWVTKTRQAHGRVKRDLTFSCDGGFQLFFASVVSELRCLAAESRGIFIRNCLAFQFPCI